MDMLFPDFPILSKTIQVLCTLHSPQAALPPQCSEDKTSLQMTTVPPKGGVLAQNLNRIPVKVRPGGSSVQDVTWYNGYLGASL